MSPKPSEGNPPKGNGERPLQSWKEIAAFLDRDVRTAIRWEKELGLPVRRHRSDRRSSVYAYANELEAWRAERKPREDSEQASWKRPVAALGAAVALLAIGLAMFRERIAPLDRLLVEAAGSEPVARKVLDDGGPTGSVSPDGRFLAFTDWRTGDLALRDLESGENRRLTDKGTWLESQQFAQFAKLSPDGRQVAYSWFTESDGYQLRVVS